MFDHLIERVFSYKDVISHSISKYYKISANFMSNFNLLFTLIFKKVRYNFDIRKDYYQLGKYLSKIDKNKFDLSYDKIFIDYINRIKIKQNQINDNDSKLKSISNKREY